MTLIINLPDEQTVACASKARAQVLSAEEYARRVLQHALVPEWLQESWQSSKQAGLDRLSVDEIKAEIAAARDPDDDIFLECAQAAQANYLVTGNLKHFPTSWSGTRVVTARRLLDVISAGTDEDPASI